ncbi:MAG TPA: copper resistance protein NlpE N-terminal domain-containing protein [Vicinamibacterales bacterium]|nr:copper resistance protein NlpE N-terminal domain-containing protein [Vicinamibacterales bacterium]
MTRCLLIIVAIVTSGSLVAAGQTTTDQTSTTPTTGSTQPAASQTGAAPALRGPLLGEYVGVLMCVDCAAVRAKLTLFATSPLSSSDGTYLFEQSYLSGHGIEQTLTRGRWRAVRGSGDDRGATVYQLDGDPPTKPQYFLHVSDEVLRLLDPQRRELPSVINTSLTRMPRPGGYIGVDPYDPDVQHAAAFAVAMWAMRSPNPPTLRAITRAERQIVEGVNYKLCLDVDVAETRQRVQTVVYRDTAQTLHLTQWLEEGCESRTLR